MMKAGRTKLCGTAAMSVTEVLPHRTTARSQADPAGTTATWTLVAHYCHRYDKAGRQRSKNEQPNRAAASRRVKESVHRGGPS